MKEGKDFMILELNHLSKEIKGVSILNDISLKLRSGHIYGIKGKNGSGKTMLMRALAGLILPTSGCVILDGKELHKDISTPDSIGVLIENPAFLPGYTGKKNLELLASLKGVASSEQICDALQRVGLDPDDKRVYRKYSLGMKQRLGIACAIMEHPDLILLDEPINAIDEKGIPQIRKALHDEKERGALILLTCHDTEELNQLADTVILLEEGKVCGQPAFIEPQK